MAAEAVAAACTVASPLGQRSVRHESSQFQKVVPPRRDATTLSGENETGNRNGTPRRFPRFPRSRHFHRLRPGAGKIFSLGMFETAPRIAAPVLLIGTYTDHAQHDEALSLLEE